jgi:hypothetical protein
MHCSITPDIEVLQDVPDDMKAQIDTKGEASLRGHLKAEGAEQTGSQSYEAPNESNDNAIIVLGLIVLGRSRPLSGWIANPAGGLTSVFQNKIRPNHYLGAVVFAAIASAVDSGWV